MIDKSKNCKEYCTYRKMCHAKGIIGQDPWDCCNYFKLDDLNNEAKEIEREERRARAEAEDGDEW